MPQEAYDKSVLGDKIRNYLSKAPPTDGRLGKPNPNQGNAYLDYLAQNNPIWAPAQKQVSEGLIDSITKMYQAGYEGSITSLAEKGLSQIGIGDEELDMFGFFDPADIEGWDPNAVEKIGSEIAGFLQPLDIATLFLGGGVGGVVAKGAVKAGAKVAGKKLLGKAATRVVGGTTGGAVGLGTYEGARGFFEGVTDKDKNILAETLKGTARGAAIGATFGATSGIVPPSIGSKLLGVKGGEIASKATKYGTEVLTMGTLMPALEGRKPTTDDYTNAAGFIAGMKTVGVVGKKVFEKAFSREKKLLQDDVSQGKSFEDAYHSGIDRVINENPGKFNTIFVNKLRLSKTPGAGQVGKKIYKELEAVGTLGDFIKDPKWREIIGAPVLKTQVRVSSETKWKNGRPVKKGGEIPGNPGWTTWNKKGRPTVYINPNHPQLVGSTLMHETYHAWKGSRVKEPQAEAFVGVGRKIAKGDKKGKWQEKRLVGSRPGTLARLKTIKSGEHETWRVDRLKAENVLDKVSLLRDVLSSAKKVGAKVTINKNAKGRDWYNVAKKQGMIDVSGKNDVLTFGKAKPLAVKKVVKKPVIPKPKKVAPPPTIKAGEPIKLPKLLKGNRNIAFRTMARRSIVQSPEASTEGSFQKHKDVLKKISSKLDFVKQVKNRFRSDKGKRFVNEFLENDARMQWWKARFMEKFADAGFSEITPTFFRPGENIKRKAKSIQIGKDIEARKAPAYNKVLDEIWEELNVVAKKEGIKVGRIQGYLKQTMKASFRDKYYNDLTEIRKALEKVTDPNDKKVLQMLKTKSEGLARLVTINRSGRSLAQATADLHAIIGAQIANTPGFLRKRTLKLTDEVRERDIRALIPEYVTGVSKYLAERKTWGPRNEKLKKLLIDMAEGNSAEGELASEMFQKWNGKWEVEHGLRGGMKKFVDAFMGFEVGTKIGMGQATILNLGQAFISMIPDLGAWSTIRGVGRLLDAKARKEIRLTGAVTRANEQAIIMIAGHNPGGPMGHFANMMTRLSGFQQVNKGLQYLAASTANVAIKGWHKKAQKNTIGGRWARDRLADFGIDYKQPISDKKMAKSMYRFAIDSQLQKNLLNDPRVFNSPAWRPFMIFKRFGYRQMTYIKDMLTREISRGNFLPLARLMVGGALAGTGVVWGLNQLKEVVSGEPYYRKDDSLMDKFITDISYIGALGMLSDVLEMEDLMSKAKFITQPVIFSDAEKLYKAFTAFTSDLSKYDDFGLAYDRNAYKAAAVLGTYPRLLIAKARTDTQKKRKTLMLKGREKSAIFQLMLDGNARAASNRVIKWNNHYDDNKFKIKLHEVGTSAMLKWLKTKARTYAKSKTADEREQRKLMRGKLKELRQKFKEARL